jgi:hypothetical protein
MNNAWRGEPLVVYLRRNKKQTKGTNSVGIVRWIWAFAYVLL